MVDVLFLDKDGTLYDDYDAYDLFPGVNSFLAHQKAAERKLYVTTGASEEGKVHLFDVESLLDGYLGREQLDSARSIRYVLLDGTIRLFVDDYARRDHFLSAPRREKMDGMRFRRSDRLDALSSGSKEREALQKRINIHFDHWRKLYFHKETHKPFDPTTKYENPHNQPGYLKDLHLARRLIAPQGYADLRTVMVGDPSDVTTVSSDPETPLVIVSNTVRKGNWGIVEVVVNHLFSSPQAKPFQMFDDAYDSALNSSSHLARMHARQMALEGSTFYLVRGERNERFIYCP